MRTEEFLLPAHWASYLIYGDASGLTDEEETEVSEWEAGHGPGPCIGCEGEPDLCMRGDDEGGMCERARFVFQVLEGHAVFSDGDIVAYH